MRTHHDAEMKWFYLVCAGLPGGLGLLLWAVTGSLPPLILVGIAVLFCVFGWPTKALVATDRLEVVFRAPARKVTVRPENLRVVKAMGAKDGRAHLNLRTRGRFPIGYRQSSYTDAPELAAAVEGIVHAAPKAVVKPGALLLLERLAACASQRSADEAGP